MWERPCVAKGPHSGPGNICCEAENLGPLRAPIATQGRSHIDLQATARRVCRRAADSVILAGFSPNSYESRAPMEIQPILNTIKDLTERSQSIRGYL